jgi:hypothetical protein
MSLARVSLTSPAPTFRPEPGRVHRLTLAWWDPAEPEGRRDPILVASPMATAQTLVVRWPTDVRGYVDLRALRAGQGIDVAPWELGQEDFERLRKLAERWPLDRHDLYVHSSWLAPCQDTLRTTSYWSDCGLERPIEAAIRRLSS